MLEKMKAEFEKWHRFPVTDDMDMQTEVAWMNWQAAWNAGISAATGWRDVVDELPNEAQEVLFVRNRKTVHGAWIGGIFWHNNEKCAAATWRPMPEPPSGNRIGAILPELSTCTKSQTDDTRRCEACRETGAIHCSDPENCGGPWTVHLTPEINEECDHAWEGGADMSQERCSKCGMSFMRYVHSCAARRRITARLSRPLPPITEARTMNDKQHHQDTMPQEPPRGNGSDLEAVVMRPVLDACCGSRMFWFDRKDSRAVFVDKRRERHTLPDVSSKGGSRELVIDPDHQADFTDLPFPDGSFALVVLDPPHFERNGATGWVGLKYGTLKGEWREELRKGFAECFRVLRPEGVLIFKWCEGEIPVSQILALTPEKPLFGHRSGKQQMTHWIAFMKGA